MITARIKTTNGNYIAIENKGYGSFAVVWCDQKMHPFKRATTEEWLWACSSWENPVEKGEWDVECEETVYFGDSSNDEEPFKERVTVHLTALSQAFIDHYQTVCSIKEEHRDNDDLDTINLYEFFENSEEGFMCSLSNGGYVVFDHMQHHGGNEWSLEFFEFRYV